MLKKLSIPFALAASLIATPAMAKNKHNCHLPNSTGIASWYNPASSSNKTASGERFTGKDMTAAHKTLPFNTIVNVTNSKTGKSIQVRINDRGPYVGGRIIDLSEAAAIRLRTIDRGAAKVSLRIARCG